MADISIRAPTRGATIWDACFHSHCFISIRAPTRGATGLYSHQNQGLSDFNPRSHEGSDLDSARMFKISALFQSALPRGERLVESVYSSLRLLFQSALPRGERLRNRKEKLHNRKISIRAPTRGATWVLSIFMQ